MRAPASAIIILALPAFVSANSFRRQQPASSCNTGQLQCCNQVESSSSSIGQAILGLFHIPVGSVTGLIGLTCTPITVVGAGGISCTAQAVCCTNNSFNGVIALGCTPVNLNL